MDNIQFSAPIKSRSAALCYKTSWKHVRQQVSAINFPLSQLIDELDPQKNFPLYCATYRYGEQILNNKGLFIPENTEKLSNLSGFSLSRNKQYEFNYAKNLLPLGIIMQNSAEVYYEGFGKIIPRYILQAGDVFGFDCLAMPAHVPSCINLCNMTSGVRNIVMVPAICDVASHKNLVRDFSLPHHPPKSLQDHWCTFKMIVDASFEVEWQSKLLFFSEKWYQCLMTDKAWRKLKEYFMAFGTQTLNYSQNLWLAQTVFYHVLHQGNFKLDPFSVDTVRHLIAIACGTEFGFKFTADNRLAPIDVIQNAYRSSYKLKYHPLIMCPSLFQISSEQPIYYSLHYPSGYALSPRIRRTSHLIQNLTELQIILHSYIEQQRQIDIGHPLLTQMANHATFTCYHIQPDEASGVKSTLELPFKDPFIKLSVTNFQPQYFPANGPMLRGCVAVTRT